MKAVFKHELSSYFTGMTAYVFGAFLLLFSGIYCMAYNLKSLVTNFEYVLGGMSFVFLIIVPILTMRVLAEEKKQRTDQLLYSLPISMTSVVLGKYFAMLVMFLIPLGIISIYPVILSAFGNVYLPASFGCIVAFFFLGAALIAIGMFVSSITESQAVAAGICFVIMLVNYFLSSLTAYVSSSAFASFAVIIILLLLLAFVFYLMTKNTWFSVLLALILLAASTLFYLSSGTRLENLLPTLMSSISLFSRFYNFIDGVFDIRIIVLYITVIIIFLFLCVQSMEKRRWSE